MRGKQITWGSPAQTCCAKLDRKCPVCNSKIGIAFIDHSRYDGDLPHPFRAFDVLEDEDGFQALCHNCGWSC